MIAKIQQDPNNFRFRFYYYNRARDAMRDAVAQLAEKGYHDIYIPGYIGWSPREGSGIFDPLNSIAGLSRHYYRMDRQLNIDVSDLKKRLHDHSILLLVNYFGFRDIEMPGIIEMAHAKDCVVIEDNAHGFYTYFCGASMGSDLTFFSLHKMFPFSKGGGLIIENGELGIIPADNLREPGELQPFSYHIHAIAAKRRENFRSLMKLMEGNEQFFVPLRRLEDIERNVPQTFPVIIRRGDRNRIYEIMNDSGFGVVSLYHTMIEELRNDAHGDACWLAARVMNLPVHQDCDENEYPAMIEALINACEKT